MKIQLNIFENPPVVTETNAASRIKGLTYFETLLSQKEQEIVISEVDARPWQNDLKRRVQHYGFKYDYKARTINFSMRIGNLPPFAISVANRLMTLGLINEFPDQVIVNEYLPGQGITAHVDCKPCFKSTIVTVSLGSTYEMDFIHPESEETASISLTPGSALVLRDDARYFWMHRIQARKTDHGNPRGRRISLTFRNVIINPS